jgi:YVTN family beta-propeller protein
MPEDVTVNPATNRVYVANYLTNSVSVLDGATNTVISNVGVGANPIGLEVNPATNRIYVSSLTSSSVSVIDGATNIVIANIGVGQFPNGIAINPNTNFIYVVNVIGSVSIIDGATNTVLYTVGVGSNPNYVDINPNTNLAYVPNLQSSNVSVIGDVLPPSLTKSFSPATINPGGVSTLTFTVTNPSPTYLLGGVGFTDNLPAQLKVAPTPNPANTCGNGTLTASPGSPTVTLSGVVLNPGQTCTVSVDITSNMPGSWTNTITSVGYFGTASPVNATAILNVTPPTLSIGNATQNEGNAGPTAFNFPVTLSAAVGVPVTVTYNTADGTATTADSDYQSVAGGTLVIPAGQTTGTITINATGDTKFETNETFTVALSSPTNATLGTGSATGTILNDDGVTALSINNVSKAEGNSGTTGFSFTVTLSAASGVAATVDYATSDGTAQAPGDYTATTGSLTFAPGETSKTITVPVNGDTSSEPDETFTVNLTNPRGAIINLGTGTATIINDDKVFGLSISDYSHREGNSGTTGFSFTVALDAPNPSPVTVSYATADGSATTADHDYQPASGSLTFAPGVTSQTVMVLVNGDTKDESDETFSVKLSNPVGAVLIKGAGIGRIINDDTRRESADLAVSLRVNPDREFDVKGETSLVYTITVTNLGPGESEHPALQLPLDPNFELTNASFAQGDSWVEKIVTSGLAPGQTPYVQVRFPTLSTSQVVTASLYLRPSQKAQAGQVIFTRATVRWDDATGAGKVRYSNAVRFGLTEGSQRNDSGGLVQFLSQDAGPVTQDRTGYTHLRLRGDFYAPDEKIELWYTDPSGTSKSLSYTYAGRDGQAQLDLYVPEGALSAGQTYVFAGKGGRSGVIGSLTLTFEGTADSGAKGNGKGSAEPS